MRETPLGDRLVVLTGTTTDRSDVPGNICIKAGSSYASVLGLTDTTWFTRRGVEIASPERIERVTGMCPMKLFQRLALLIGM